MALTHYSPSNTEGHVEKLREILGKPEFRDHPIKRAILFEQYNFLPQDDNGYASIKRQYLTAAIKIALGNDTIFEVILYRYYHRERGGMPSILINSYPQYYSDLPERSGQTLVHFAFQGDIRLD